MRELPKCVFRCSQNVQCWWASRTGLGTTTLDNNSLSQTKVWAETHFFFSWVFFFFPWTTTNPLGSSDGWINLHYHGMSSSSRNIQNKHGAVCHWPKADINISTTHCNCDPTASLTMNVNSLKVCCLFNFPKKKKSFLTFLKIARWMCMGFKVLWVTQNKEKSYNLNSKEKAKET